MRSAGPAIFLAALLGAAAVFTLAVKGCAES